MIPVFERCTLMVADNQVALKAITDLLKKNGIAFITKTIPHKNGALKAMDPLAAITTDNTYEVLVSKRNAQRARQVISQMKD